MDYINRRFLLNWDFLIDYIAENSSSITGAQTIVLKAGR
jgi:hypothetical protein